jgi:Fe-S cluster assembly protein SufD
LSKNALVESKPNLEILADDVFCTHGSATGRQNPEELFYVRSRALNEEKAEDLLVHGFLKEVYDEVRLWRKKAGLQNNNEKL